MCTCIVCVCVHIVSMCRVCAHCVPICSAPRKNNVCVPLDCILEPKLLIAIGKEQDVCAWMMPSRI